jgi:hypothetical protein
MSHRCDGPGGPKSGGDTEGTRSHFRGQRTGSGAYLGDGHGALLQHQTRDSQIGYPARHPRAARHRTSGTLGRIPPALRSTGTARSRGSTTGCSHLRHIRHGLTVPRLDFPADGPADLLAGGPPGCRQLRQRQPGPGRRPSRRWLQSPNQEGDCRYHHARYAPGPRCLATPLAQRRLAGASAGVLVRADRWPGSTATGPGPAGWPGSPGPAGWPGSPGPAGWLGSR